MSEENKVTRQMQYQLLISGMINLDLAMRNVGTASHLAGSPEKLNELGEKISILAGELALVIQMRAGKTSDFDAVHSLLGKIYSGLGKEVEEVVKYFDVDDDSIIN